MEQTTARLRKTFGYPLDGEFESESHEAIDEEEQDSIIRKMKEDNAERNKQYNTALFSFSLVANLPYLTTLFTRQTALLSLLSISSLLSTAYLIYCTQPGKTGIAFLDKSNMHLKPQSMAARKEAMLQAIDGPIKLYLPYLNIGLCCILVALGCVANRKEVELWWGFEWLPAAVYTVAITAKWIMGGVDPEEELGRLRYELKGA
ncbi:hypothetical protein PZA11_004354 [Diplocarpon coronariae]|uniref:Uncharacterized protein n=1 Tax=Diplocarpon coronariae TaxID=2795749 RepID=A0A218YYX1_9HELO|nr:hypothetical protein B2J93_4282 [Marssonina coronariae]